MATAEGRAALNFFFASIPLSEFPTPKDNLAIVNSDDTLKDVVQLLRTRNVLSCPVRNVDVADDKPWTDRYAGLVDMVGIALYLMDHTSGRESHAMHEHQQLATTKVIEVSETARWSAFVPLEPTHSLYDAMLVMGKYCIHRIPLVADGRIVNLITQSAVIAELAKHSDQFASVGKKTLHELGMAEASPVWSVKLDDTVRDGMKLIASHRINAVPVLGVNGAVVGNLSARDLRATIVDPKYFHLINKRVSEFLSEVSALDHEEMSPAITCRAHDTLEKIIQQLAATRIHRVYLCDGSNRPLRVVSLSDILQQFATPSEGYFEDPRFAQVTQQQ